MRRLLILDDNPQIADLIGRFAHDSGFEVQTTLDFGQFAKRMEEHPDVVVMDLVMPEMDGVEIIRWLACLDCRPALILISGFNQRVLRTAEMIARGRGLQVLGTLTKPFKMLELIGLLRSLAEAPSRPRLKSMRELSALDLTHALEADEIDVHFQPKVSLKTKKLCGVEALARWQHPELGRIGPDAFIGLAERNALIDRLTEVILSKALQQGVAWRRQGLDTRIAINISCCSLNDLDLPQRIIDLAKFHGLELNRLIVEVTESSVTEDLMTALDVLTRLCMKGVQLAIDDFGTGYSTLEQLSSIPFTELKIDKSFVKNAQRDDGALAIVESSIELAHRLKLRVVAEGVESVSDWELLRALGCDEAQGYLIARPMPRHKLQPWFEAWEDHGTEQSQSVGAGL